MVFHRRLGERFRKARLERKKMRASGMTIRKKPLVQPKFKSTRGFESLFRPRPVPVPKSKSKKVQIIKIQVVGVPTKKKKAKKKSTNGFRKRSETLRMDLFMRI